MPRALTILLGGAAVPPRLATLTVVLRVHDVPGTVGVAEELAPRFGVCVASRMRGWRPRSCSQAVAAWAL
jgi:hypothetical protein